LKNREFSKVDRFLTCRSLLFTKRKLYTILNSGYFNNIANLITKLQNEDTNENNEIAGGQDNINDANLTAGQANDQLIKRYTIQI